RKHGGMIEASSPGEGQGSTFRVVLPLRSVDGVTDPAVAAPGKLAGEEHGRSFSIAGMHVLVVDDNADARDLLATVLESRGAIVQSASSVVAAIDIIKRRKPDVLLSDVRMPIHDGYTLIQKVRALERERHDGHLPAIAVTAYASTEDRKQSIAL